MENYGILLEKLTALKADKLLNVTRMSLDGKHITRPSRKDHQKYKYMMDAYPIVSNELSTIELAAQSIIKAYTTTVQILNKPKGCKTFSLTSSFGLVLGENSTEVHSPVWIPDVNALPSLKCAGKGKRYDSRSEGLCVKSYPLYSEYKEELATEHTPGLWTCKTPPHGKVKDVYTDVPVVTKVTDYPNLDHLFA